METGTSCDVGKAIADQVNELTKPGLMLLLEKWKIGTPETLLE